jgi:hypothetical protein
MATDTKYRIFKEIYDEETKRYSELDGKAKLYVTIITFYLGATAFKFKDVIELTGAVPCGRWLYLAMGSVLIAALLRTVLAIRIRNFEGICNPVEVIREIAKTLPNDDDFREDRIVDLAVATNRNSAQNDNIARNLSFASVFILLAGIIQFALFAIALAK